MTTSKRIPFDPDELLLRGWARKVPNDRERIQAAFALGDIIPANGFYMAIPDAIEAAVRRGHTEAAVRWALWEELRRKHFHALPGDVVGVGEIVEGAMSLRYRPEVGASVTVLPEFWHWRESVASSGDTVEERLPEDGKLDGPVPPDVFNHQGREYPGLDGVAWKLVNVIWDGRDRQVDLTDEGVQREIWHDSEFEPEQLWENRFHYARGKVNAFFADNEIPYRVEKVARSDFVRIVQRTLTQR